MLAKEPVYKVVSPVDESTTKVKPLAPSLKTLEGKTICELWNKMFQGEVTFPIIEELLSKRYPGIKFVSYAEFGSTHGPDEKTEKAMIEALPDKLKKYRCDAVISGNGGWGSCTPAATRASVVAENMGIPTVTVATEGFTIMAKSVGEGSGYPNLRVVTYPGVINTHESDTIRKNVEKVLVDQIVKALVEPAEKVEPAAAAGWGDREIVFSGPLEEVNQFFYENRWTDGLPIIPPTIKKVEEFLKYTDRSPDEVLGILPPRHVKATVWKVAVNGVMAGCRPEYMPILLAIVEVMADPHYGLEHSGSTPGWEAMIILNGPIRKQLGFNYQIAVQRPGNQANTSIGRFYRLFLRNVPGFLPGTTDMATFGHMFRAVVPENDEACEEIGWKPLHVQRGFKPEDNVVTITSIRAISDPFQTMGERAERHLDYIVNWVKRIIEPFEASEKRTESNVVLLSPVVASVIAQGGYSKEDVNRYIMEHAVVPANEFEWNLAITRPQPVTLSDLVEQGALPEEWDKSPDPNRMVPILLPSSGFLIVVTGDPKRNRNTVYRNNHMQGFATSKKIKLPANWDKLMADIKK